MKKISFLAVILLLSVSAFAILPPGNIQTAFKKMYPKANGIAWSQDDGYYCANFVMNGFTKNVWFNTQAQWQMTQTDLVSLDRVTPTVYNAFVSSPYASWVVNDVTLGCMVFSDLVFDTDTKPSHPISIANCKSTSF